MKKGLVFCIAALCTVALLLPACQSQPKSAAEAETPAPGTAGLSNTDNKNNTNTPSGTTGSSDSTAKDNVPLSYVSKGDPKSSDMADMNLYTEYPFFDFPDDPAAVIRIYVNAKKDEKGYLYLDEKGNDWLLVVDSVQGKYVLFERQTLVQGDVSCVISSDDAKYQHATVIVYQNNEPSAFDYIYDPAKKAFEKHVVPRSDIHSYLAPVLNQAS